MIAAMSTITSRTVVLAEANIDTDQIIPARFLTTTERTGLGRHAFADWRYLADGSDNPAFVLNQPPNAGAQILVRGRNFGRSDERRVGKECVRTCRSRWSQNHLNKKNHTTRR